MKTQYIVLLSILANTGTVNAQIWCQDERSGEKATFTSEDADKLYDVLKIQTGQKYLVKTDKAFLFDLNQKNNLVDVLTTQVNSGSSRLYAEVSLSRSSSDVMVLEPTTFVAELKSISRYQATFQVTKNNEIFNIQYKFEVDIPDLTVSDFLKLINMDYDEKIYAIVDSYKHTTVHTKAHIMMEPAFHFPLPRSVK